MEQAEPDDGIGETEVPEMTAADAAPEAPKTPPPYCPNSLEILRILVPAIDLEALKRVEVVPVEDLAANIAKACLLHMVTTIPQMEPITAMRVFAYFRKYIPGLLGKRTPKKTKAPAHGVGTLENVLDDVRHAEQASGPGDSH